MFGTRRLQCVYTELVSRGRNVEEGVEKRKEGRDEGR